MNDFTNALSILGGSLFGTAIGWSLTLAVFDRHFLVTVWPLLTLLAFFGVALMAWSYHRFKAEQAIEEQEEEEIERLEQELGNQDPNKCKYCKQDIDPNELHDCEYSGSMTQTIMF